MRKNETTQKSNITVYLYIAALVIFTVAIINFQSSIDTKDYTRVDGYITDTTTETKLAKGGERVYYNYTIHWYSDDMEYSRHVTDALSAPDIDSEIYADKDNTTAILSSPDSISNTAKCNFIVSILLLILAVVFHLREMTHVKKTGVHKQAKEAQENIENIHIYSGICIVVFLSGSLFTGLPTLQYIIDHSTMNNILRDLFIIFIVLMIINIIIFNKTKQK